MSEHNSHTLALIMIASVRAAMKNNVKHFTKDGKPLNSEIEIIEALRTHGEITFDVSNRVQNTTDAIELKALCDKYHIPVPTE